MAQSSDSALKKFAYGTCAYARLSPQLTQLSSATTALNIPFSFEEALKLNLAIDECVRKLNRYKRSTKVGKKAALCLTIHFDLQRVAVSEGKL